MPPTGRIKKPTPKVAVVSKSEAYSLPAGKNRREIMTVKKPYTTKSYHSSAFPITAATICLVRVTVTGRTCAFCIAPRYHSSPQTATRGEASQEENTLCFGAMRKHGTMAKPLTERDSMSHILTVIHSLLVALCYSWVGPAYATSVVEVTFTDLVAQAEVIAVGTVTEIREQWDTEKKTPLTLV